MIFTVTRREFFDWSNWFLCQTRFIIWIFSVFLQYIQCNAIYNYKVDKYVQIGQNLSCKETAFLEKQKTWSWRENMMICYECWQIGGTDLLFWFSESSKSVNGELYARAAPLDQTHTKNQHHQIEDVKNRNTEHKTVSLFILNKGFAKPIS